MIISPRRTCFSAIISAALAAAALSIHACAYSRPSQPKVTSRVMARPQLAAKVNADTKSSKSADPFAGSFAGSGGLSGEHRDPKTGALLWKLWAENVRLDHANKNFTGLLSVVTIHLYEKGKLAAVLKAPLATGNNADNKIVATNGVTVQSVDAAGKPAGQSLRADKIVCTMSRVKNAPGKIEATGRVVYIDRATATSFRAPRLVTDTKLKKISTSDADFFLNADGTLRRK